MMYHRCTGHPRTLTVLQYICKATSWILEDGAAPRRSLAAETARLPRDIDPPRLQQGGPATANRVGVGEFVSFFGEVRQNAPKELGYSMVKLNWTRI